jgi:hypothetical protein
MNLNDAPKAPTGHFVLNVFRDGELVECFEEKNLIVNGSKPTHAHLLGGDVTNRSITQIQFGTSGAAAGAGNTAITAPFTKAVDLVDYPTTDSVRFAFSLTSGENNGMAIMEFGLLTAGSVLYARKVRTVALNKESDLSFSGTWTITF